jgi:hypothetical protein
MNDVIMGFLVFGLSVLILFVVVILIYLFSKFIEYIEDRDLRAEKRARERKLEQRQKYETERDTIYPCATEIY